MPFVLRLATIVTQYSSAIECDIRSVQVRVEGVMSYCVQDKEIDVIDEKISSSYKSSFATISKFKESTSKSLGGANPLGTLKADYHCGISYKKFKG